MSTESGAVTGAAATASSSRSRLLRRLGTGGFWVVGAAIVAAAQPGTHEKEAAAAAAAAGIATILVLGRLTEDRDRRYLRSVLGASIAVSLVATWLVRRLTGVTYSFRVEHLDKRIVLPLLFVLVAPLAAPGALRLYRPGQREGVTALLRRLRPMDWIVAAYALLSLPALALGLVHHASKTYIAQDLGLIVFFVVMYVAGRVVTAQTARAGAGELVDVLLLLGAAQLLLLDWEPAPLYSYLEAACAAAIAVVLLRWRSFRLLPVGLAIVLLATDVVAVRNGSSSTIGIELAGAFAVLGYLVVRLRPLVPRWLIVAVAVAVLAVFVGFTSDGATVRGQYHGSDPSNAGRTFEAQRVRTEIRRSTLSVVLGRGLGATINETHAPKEFKQSLSDAGRQLAHVPEVHLLEYQFLLEFGLVGVAWLAAFVLGVAWVAVSGLERAVRKRDTSLVIYAALPLLGLAGALAAASHLQDNPLNALALGILVTLLGQARPEAAD